jgi:DnaJ-domain-containing protein 1
MTYYEVLEIDSRASTEDVERAYRRLARKVHPDLNAGDAARAEARMKLLNEIRETLTDPLMRAGYDERLRLESMQRERAVPPRRDAPTAQRPEPAASAAAPGGLAESPVEAAGPTEWRAPWGALLLVALGAAGAAAAFVFYPRLAKPRSDDLELSAPVQTAGADAAPLLATPVMGTRPPGGPEARPTRLRARGRGVVHLGSSADDVLRLLGPPDRIEAGRRPGESVMRYGTLRLEMKNGRVVGGDAAAR